MINVLALNAACIPIEIVTWKRAISLWFTGKARVITEYEDKFVHSPKMKIAVPAVIQYTESMDEAPTPKFVTFLPFNRRNLFIRDKGQCMYCGRKVSLSSFTYDHVHPQKLGGQTDWKNVVAACQKCNGKKGCKVLKLSGLKLIQAPYIPKLTKAAPLSVVRKLGLDFEHGISHPSWNDYIYWNVTKM